MKHPSRTPAKRRSSAKVQQQLAIVTPEANNSEHGGPKSNKKKEKTIPRTESFDAVWYGRIFPDRINEVLEPHTLVLGTHPSIKSLAQSQYYGHPMNAFWWIAGDCLGFRRAEGVSASSGKDYKFASSLRYGCDKILPYEKQVEEYVKRGFALWDIVQSCSREGSLDHNIREERPNDIVGFCEKHKSIRRIVISNGATGSKQFVKHFGDWLQSGSFVVADNKESCQAFGKKIRSVDPDDGECLSAITLVTAMSPSPAAAKYSYEEKRSFWEKYVFQPGLKDYKDMTNNSKNI